MPELKQLELNAKDNAEQWKTYEETEEFRKVYLRKTPEQRSADAQALKYPQDRLEDEEQCTVDPPQI